MRNYYNKYRKYKTKYQKAGTAAAPQAHLKPEKYYHKIKWSDSNKSFQASGNHKVPVITQDGDGFKVTTLVSSSSKSGSNIYQLDSEENHYILKSLNYTEYESLKKNKRQFLNELSTHIQKKKSFICPIFLLINSSHKIYWILMENIDYIKDLDDRKVDNSSNSWKFDIKGSYINRQNNNTGKCQDNKCQEGMDRDYIAESETRQELKIPLRHRDNTLSILSRDMEFLINKEKIDYSLILKASESHNGQYQYQLGIIDYLQKYNNLKYLENKYKSFRVGYSNKDGITIKNASKYGNRFFNMIKCFIIKQDCDTVCHFEDKKCCNKNQLITDYQKKYPCH